MRYCVIAAPTDVSASGSIYFNRASDADTFETLVEGAGPNEFFESVSEAATAIAKGVGMGSLPDPPGWKYMVCKVTRSFRCEEV